MSLISEAAERNKSPIGDVLETVLPAAGSVLEIASGTGQHVAYFAKRFPKLTWVPSDPNPQAREAIEQKQAESPLSNCLTPLDLDVNRQPWPPTHANFILCCNMIHISSPESTPALFHGAAALLRKNERLLIYGPFFCEQETPAPSNVAFDKWLKSLDASFGIKTLETVVKIAEKYRFTLRTRVHMPANNLSLLFEKTG